MFASTPAVKYALVSSRACIGVQYRTCLRRAVDRQRSETERHRALLRDRQHGGRTSQRHAVHQVVGRVAAHAGAGRADQDLAAAVDDVLDHVLDRRVERIGARDVRGALAHPVDAGADQEHRHFEAHAYATVGDAPGHRRAFVVETVRDDHDHLLLLLRH